MNWLRKTDWFIQFTVVILALLATLYAGIYILLYAQIYLAIVQITGAGIHAFSQLPSVFRKAIKNYWLFVFGYFFTLQFSFVVESNMQIQGDWLFITRYILIPWAIAIYYLFWYMKLINHIEFQQELKGLIKS